MTRRPRVGIFHYQTYPEIRLAKFADALVDAGMDVVVVARDVVVGSDPRGKHPYGIDLSPKPHLELRSVAGAGAGRVRRAASTPYPFSPLWVSEVRRVLDEGVDVVIARDFHLSPLVVGLAHRRGVPAMVDIAENYPALLKLWRSYEGPKRAVMNSVIRNVALARMVERRGVGRADAVSVVVPEHEARMRAMGARNVVTIENTPDLRELLAGFDRDQPSLRHTDQGSTRPLKVVYTGEIHLYRGIDTVIEAAAILKASGFALEVQLVGTGKLFDDLRAMARDRGVDDIVEFLGWQPDLRPFIAASDVGLIPPHASEHQEMTMPNKLYDFMAFGKPVVVSDATPMKRVVTNAGCGAVFPAASARGLAEALRSLGDPIRRATCGNNAKSAVKSTYNWDRDANVLIDTVCGLLRSMPNPSGSALPLSAMSRNEMQSDDTNSEVAS